jgi:UDP-N-acetylmuramate dehydrogenase
VASSAIIDRAAIERAVGGEGECRFDEPMARHTTLRIGGPVDAWVAPSTVGSVRRLRALCASTGWPCRAVGAGSNLLVRDGGVRGVLVSSEQLRQLEFAEGEQGKTVVKVGAGIATGKLLSEATRRGLGGVEFLGGVPGSVGGGLIMNAGTYLGEFKDVTTRVCSVGERGDLVERAGAECGFVYRGSAIPPSEIVVSGELLLAPRPREAIEADVRALRDRRRAREPHGVPNAGSIFKNPPGEFAGRLIEQCGLKGRRVGGAEVSPAHANWIVNAGQARAADVLALVDVVRAEVRERFGLFLELEVKVVGEDDHVATQ